MRRRCARLIAAAFAVCSFQAGAAGLRSFAALPVGKGGGVARVQFEHEFDADSTRAKTVIGIGLSGTQSLFLDLPFSSKRTPYLSRGDPGILYRHTLWQVDSPGATARAALLAGFVLPTGDAGDSARYDVSWQMCMPPFSNDLNTTHNASLMLGGRLRF